MVRKLAVVTSILVLSAAGATAQTSTVRQGEPEVKRLLVLMDTDRSGKVSRAEFMAFMGAEFDRLDTDHSGELDVGELAGLRVVSAKHTGGAGSK